MHKLNTEFIGEILLQLFNDGDGAGGSDDGNTGANGNSDGQTAGNSGDGDQGNNGSGDDKKFTQKDMDDAIKKRLERQKKSMQAEYQQSDEYKDFQKWKDDQATADEKRQAELEAIQSTKDENARLKAEIEELQNRGKLEKIDPKFRDFAMFEIQKLVTDDVDFDDALKSFSANKDNAHMLLGSNTGRTTGTNQNPGTGSQNDRVSAILKSVGYSHAVSGGAK